MAYLKHPPHSLVLITVDCLRADHVGFLGYRRPTTPFLDALSRSSCIFTNAIAAGSPTYYSLPAIMASRYPLSLGREVIGIAPGEPTLASCLHDQGYSTAAFLAGNPYLSRRFGYDFGFDEFHDFLNRAAGVHEQPQATSAGAISRLNRRIAELCHSVGPLRRSYDDLYFRYASWQCLRKRESLDELRRYPAADVIVSGACDWLERRGKDADPFFLWLHFMDPHAPYYPTSAAMAQMEMRVNAREARRLNLWWDRGDVKPSRLARRSDDVIRLYDAGVRWVDTQIARLVEKMEMLGLWESCVLTVTADHGEEFLDHGRRYHTTSSLTENLIHVPLLIRAPGTPARSEAAAISSLNLAPTVLDILGIPVPASFRGVSRWQGKNEEPAVISECIAGCNNPWNLSDRFRSRLLAIRESRYKLVFDFTNSLDELFDLEVDPGERHPLGGNQYVTVRRRLLERAREHIAGNSCRAVDSKIAAGLREMKIGWSNGQSASAARTELAQAQA